jgi:uncharacterized protein YjbI with pentapeptide repeats
VEINGLFVGPRANLANADLSGCQLGESTESWNAGGFNDPNGNDIDMVSETTPAVSLSESNLVQVNLSNAKCNKVCFTAADLTDAVLVGADLQQADFTGAILRGADLSGADIQGAIFTDADLSGATLRSVIVTEDKVKKMFAHLGGYTSLERFDYATLSGVDLSDSNFSDVNFRGADLSGTNFSEAMLDGANFAGARLSRANFARASLWEANLAGADLEFADATGAKLDGANLSGCDLAHANFRNASLRRSNLGRVDAKQSTFAGADLSRAELAEGLFGKSDFSGANLSDANLASSIFWSAILTSANLTGAYAGHEFYSRGNRMPYQPDSLARSTDRRPGASFMNARLNFSVLDKSVLTDASFMGADLANASIELARAEFARFSGANLTGVSFRSSLLESADFSKSTLGSRELTADEQIRIDSWLAGAENSYSDASAFPERQVEEFTSRRTRRTDFSGAKLKGAVFIGVDMEKAFFGDADLGGNAITETEQ